MSIAFLPQPQRGLRTFYGDETAQPVLILGYDDNEGEWVVITPEGEATSCPWDLIQFKGEWPA